MAATHGIRSTDIKVADKHGTQQYVQMSDGTGASGNLPKFNADGSLTDSGVAASGGATRPGFIAYYLEGKPAAGATIKIPIPGNMGSFQVPANFSGAQGDCGTNPTATATYTFYKNGTSFGTASISTSGTFTWSTGGGAAVSFTVGTDRLSWSAPGTQDATLSDVDFSIPVTIS